MLASRYIRFRIISGCRYNARVEHRGRCTQTTTTTYFKPLPFNITVQSIEVNYYQRFINKMSLKLFTYKNAINVYNKRLLSVNIRFFFIFLLHVL